MGGSQAMSETSNEDSRNGQAVLTCTDLDATSAFFRDRLGFRLE